MLRTTTLTLPCALVAALGLAACEDGTGDTQNTAGTENTQQSAQTSEANRTGTGSNATGTTGAATDGGQTTTGMGGTTNTMTGADSGTATGTGTMQTGQGLAGTGAAYGVNAAPFLVTGRWADDLDSCDDTDDSWEFAENSLRMTGGKVCTITNQMASADGTAIEMTVNCAQNATTQPGATGATGRSGTTPMGDTGQGTGISSPNQTGGTAGTETMDQQQRLRIARATSTAGQPANAEPANTPNAGTTGSAAGTGTGAAGTGTTGGPNPTAANNGLTPDAIEVSGAGMTGTQRLVRCRS